MKVPSNKYPLNKRVPHPVLRKERKAQVTQEGEKKFTKQKGPPGRE